MDGAVPWWMSSHLVSPMSKKLANPRFVAVTAAPPGAMMSLTSPEVPASTRQLGPDFDDHRARKLRHTHPPKAVRSPPGRHSTIPSTTGSPRPGRHDRSSWPLAGGCIIENRVTPTVIVARRPRTGHERDFERWLHNITDTAAAMPGHLGSELQPPSPSHPNEWVIVYQFESQSLLDNWLESPHRAELLALGADLTDGQARVQRLAINTGDDPVTAVASFRVRPENREAFKLDYEHVAESMATFDGFVSTQLFAPVEGVQEDTVIVFSFRSQPHLDGWLSSDERRHQLERLDEHIDGERQLNVVDGYAGWFSFGPRKVKTWKQAATVLLALYPTVLVLNGILGRLLPDNFPYLLTVLAGNIGGVAILSWLIMPKLTEALDSWLRR